MIVFQTHEIISPTLSNAGFIYQSYSRLNRSVKPAFDKVGEIISWVWNNVIKPTWDLIKEAAEFLETIISQLHNYFLHRLVNNLDIHAIEKAVAYLDRVSFESLPILPTGACVLSGVSAQVPVVVKIAELPQESAPNSRTMSVTTEWLKPLPLADDDEGEFGELDGRLGDGTPF